MAARVGSPGRVGSPARVGSAGPGRLARPGRIRRPVSRLARPLTWFACRRAVPTYAADAASGPRLRRLRSHVLSAPGPRLDRPRPDDDVDSGAMDPPCV